LSEQVRVLAEIATHIVVGKRAADVAAAFGVSVHTVRICLAAHAKTCCEIDNCDHKRLRLSNFEFEAPRFMQPQRKSGIGNSIVSFDGISNGRFGAGFSDATRGG
jgi:hypothetical protein